MTRKLNTGILKSAWQILRGNYWGSLAFDVFLIIVAFSLVSMWQTRNLPDDEHTPVLEAVWLDEMKADSVMVAGEVGVVYFFAPWCPYCSASADNIVRLRRIRDERNLTILMVALDWQDRDEISEYALNHELNVPVLLGDATVARNWHVFSFPTYYMLDDELRVIGRDMGYSCRSG